MREALIPEPTDMSETNTEYFAEEGLKIWSQNKIYKSMHVLFILLELL